VFASSWELDIDWAAVDPEIDWHRYQRGITVAAMRWMIDHNETGYSTFASTDIESGQMDTGFHDAHDILTGMYRGGPLMPDAIAENIYAIIDREKMDGEKKPVG
jgi:hypothetical protein